MKIDMVSEHASPSASLGGADAGGQNVHVAALAVALAERGHEITVYTRRDDPDLPETVPFAPGVVVEHVTAGPAESIPKDELLPHMGAFADRLAERWRRRPPDIVHGHFWMSGLAAVTATTDLPVPVVETFHALGSVKRRFQAEADHSPAERIRIEAAVALNAQAIIATCTDEVGELAGYGIDPGRTFVVPSGVDCEHFRPSGPIAPRGDHPRILTIGRLVPRKGIETVIRAVAAIPDAELLVAGGPGPEGLDDDPEVRRLRAVVAAVGLGGRVRFVGRTAHERVPALMRSADVVVSDPWYEPFGIVPLEAMACARPVVVSAVGGHLDTVTDGVTGLLTPPRDPQALANRLRLLLRDGALRRSLGAAAAEHVRARYRWSRIAAETEAVYQHVTAENPVRHALTDGARS